MSLLATERISTRSFPGLGIGELNEEMIREYAHEKFGEQWQNTDAWNGEWANDLTWS